MKKIFMIFLVFIFSFGVSFANEKIKINEKLTKINLNIYIKKLKTIENGEKYIEIIDKKINSFSEEELWKYKKNLENYLKTYKGEYFNLLKYFKFKIDFVLVKGDFGKKVDKKIDDKNISEKSNSKVYKKDEFGFEITFPDGEKIDESSKEYFEKNILNKNEKSYYYYIDEEKNIKFTYFKYKKDIYNLRIKFLEEIWTRDKFLKYHSEKIKKLEDIKKIQIAGFDAIRIFDKERDRFDYMIFTPYYTLEIKLRVSNNLLIEEAEKFLNSITIKKIQKSNITSNNKIYKDKDLGFSIYIPDLEEFPGDYNKKVDEKIPYYYHMIKKDFFELYLI